MMLSNWADSLAAKLRRTPLSGIEGHLGKQNLWISAYPISGNSYISYVIAYVLNSNYRDVDSPDWSPQRVPLQKYLEGTNSHSQSQKCDRVLKTHAPPSTLPLASQGGASADGAAFDEAVDGAADHKVIYIVRNVHDVANSYFHRVEKTWANSPSWKRRLLSRLSKTLIPFRLRYRFAIRYFSRRWAAQVQEVLDVKDMPVLKYEQFMASPYETLERIINYIDPTSWNEEIARDALEIFSFKNMKAAAKQAMPNPATRTDRVGGSGDYQKYFSPSDIAWFNQEYHDILAEVDSRAWFGPEKPAS